MLRKCSVCQPACLAILSYKMLLLWSEPVAESSDMNHVNFSCMNFAMGVDDSMCQEDMLTVMAKRLRP